MSDRNVRDPSQALAQRLDRLESRVRALTLRAWPGAIRTGITAESAITPEDPTVEETLLTVSAVPGRWVMLGQTNITVTNPAEAYVDLRVTLMVIDPETGVEPLDCVCDAPYRRYFAANPPGTIATTLTTLGQYTSENVANVVMTAVNMYADAYSASASRLILVPV